MRFLYNLRKILFVLVALLTGSNLSAQITDNFGDGDFTNTPTWSGDNTEFIVNPAFQLQLNGVAADTSSLSFASPFISNAEWQFWVKLTFAPSDNNNVRIYLVSDVANLEGPVNGYYIRMGENGSFDSVDLWEQTGTTSTKIIDGINGHCALSSNTIRIKVTRDAAGNWALLSDTLGGTNFLPEGNVFDNTHTTCNYAGVFCKYTVSNITKFFFDDVYAGPPIVDLTAPTLVSATATSVNTLDVLFNESVDLATAQTLTNFSVNNSIGTPSIAVRDGSNLSLVHLTFATNFTNATSYTLTVNNVQDLNANAIISATTNFIYFIAAAAVYRDVVINEIMADPSPQVGLPNTEFIELYNRGTGIFDLAGWTFTDGSTTATLSSFILAPGQYVTVCAVADTALLSPFGNVVAASSMPSLNNAGDFLSITSNTSVLIDSLRFDIAWYQDATKDDGGWTLEQINPNAVVGCGLAGNWIASSNVAGGTPGTQNSVFNNSPDQTAPGLVFAGASDSVHVEICFTEGISPALLSDISNYTITPAATITNLTYDSATFACVTLTLATPLSNNTTYTVNFAALADCAGNAVNPGTTNFSWHEFTVSEIVINEIMADPDPPVGLPNEEYLELHNRTNFPVRLKNWQLTIGSTTRLLPDVVLPADSFIILTSTTAAPLFPGFLAAGVTSFQSLTNTGGSITLRTPAGLLIHHVSYDDSWYKDASKDDGGWSLEQIDPSNPCGGTANWRASTFGWGGTPGFTNSVNAANADGVLPQLLRVSILRADSIRLWFSEPMDSLSLANTSLFTIDNSIGNPVSVAPLPADFSKVDLLLPQAIQSNIIYTVTVATTISDCIGNNMGTPNTAPFALPSPAAPKDIVINEILFDPRDGGVDFVEIYNRSNKVIDLQKLVLCTRDTLANIFDELNIIAPEGFLLFPNQYLVLSEDRAAVKANYPVQTDLNQCLDMDNIPSMNIDGDIVVIVDSAFQVIDELLYLGDWHFPLLQETKGVSLERIDFDRTTQDATNWHSAAETVGFATPTQKNSAYNEGEITDGSVTVSNEVFSPDGDGVDDVVNINYDFDIPGFVSTITIYDSRGRLVRNLVRNELLGTEQGTFSWDGVTDDRSKARTGIYVIYFEAFATDGTVKHYKLTCVLASRF